MKNFKPITRPLLKLRVGKIKYLDWQKLKEQSVGGRIIRNLDRLDEDCYLLQLDKEDLLKELQKLMEIEMEKAQDEYDDNYLKVLALNRHIKHFCSDAYSALQHMRNIEIDEKISEKLKSIDDFEIAKNNFCNNGSVKFLNDIRRYYDHYSLCFASYWYVIPPLKNRNYNISLTLDKDQLLSWCPSGRYTGKGWSKESLNIINNFNFKYDAQIDLHVEKYLDLYTKYYQEFYKSVCAIFKQEIVEWNEIMKKNPLFESKSP